MKKTLIAVCLGICFAGSVMAQPVSDRAVIPLGVTLQQILRVHVTNGGNIEFVFNDINDYKNGIANSAFYDTDVVLASSTNWEMHFGAEDATLIGTDDPTRTLALNNVGFTITWTGNNTCCAAGNQVSSITGNYDNSSTGTANGLLQYTGLAGDVLFTDGGNVGGSGGDITDNAFTINWECGTQIAGGTTPMNNGAGSSILAQSPAADRYVTNIFIDINAL
jgi:hypothetical protein